MADEENCVECRTILNCTKQLKLTLKGDQDIALFLYQSGFIARPLYNEVLNATSMLSEEQKAMKLLSRISDAVEVNPQKYNQFIDQLRKNPRLYEDIVSILDQKFHQLSK